MRQVMQSQVTLLHAAESDVEVPDAGRLAYLMTMAAARDVVDDGFAEFVMHAIAAITRLGVGEDFGRSAELDAAMRAAAVALGDHGLATTDVHLGRATYLASLATGGEERRAAIEDAVSASSTADEYLRARLALALYAVDTSDYRAAQRIADDCELRAASARAANGAVLAEARLVRALAFYYSGDRRAAAAFRAVLDLGDDLTSSAPRQKTLATAHHFIGRILALAGDYEPALAELIEAQRMSGGSGIQQRVSRAFFHMRLVEILLAVGTLEEAHYHAVQAERLVRLVRDSTSGEAHLDMVVARVELARGDWRKAEVLLHRALAVTLRDNYHRGALLAMAQLVRVHVADRHLGRAVTVAVRALRLWWSTEAARAAAPVPGARWRAARMSVRTARRTLVWRTAPPLGRLHCPCGADHVVP
jgi:tetratricopeptide (TPR) repeat protein